MKRIEANSLVILLNFVFIKGKNHKLRTPVTGSGSPLGHLKKPESEAVANESIKKKNNSTTNNQPTKLSITTVLEKINVVNAEIRWCLNVVKSKFPH